MATVTVAQGARSQLLYKKQTALGTQATGDFTTARFETNDLDTMIGNLVNNEIRSDREVQDERHGNRHGTCQIVTPLIFEDHDTFIESAMFNTFGSDSVKIGTTPQYLSIEDGALDINQYRMGVDMVCDSMAVSIQANATNPVRTTFQFVGTNVSNPAGSSSGGTAIAPTNNSPFDQYTGALYENAEESGDEVGVVTGLDFTINNSVAPVFVIGQQTAPFLEFGRGRVSGTATILYESATWINRFLNETETVLVMNLTDPDGNVMEFRFPRVKFTGGNVPVANEQSRIITLPFTALREDAAGGTALQITKA